MLMIPREAESVVRGLAVLGMLAGFAAVQPIAADPASDAEAIRAAVIAGAKGCEAGRPHLAMAAVDRALVLSYPGTPDLGYDGLVAGYARLCKGEGEDTLATTVPTFEEVSVNGDIALVRITWATHLRGMPDGAVRYLRDWQLWRRTPDGWRFFRGVHYAAKGDPPR